MCDAVFGFLGSSFLSLAQASVHQETFGLGTFGLGSQSLLLHTPNTFFYASEPGHAGLFRAFINFFQLFNHVPHPVSRKTPIYMSSHLAFRFSIC